MKNRVLALLLTLCLAVGLASCGSTPQTPSAPPAPPPQTVETARETENPAGEAEEAADEAESPAGEAEEAADETTSQGQAPDQTVETDWESLRAQELPEDGTYSSKEDVGDYIYLYGHLPSNFITKKEAEKLGWTGGSLEPYAPGCCIGGSRFGNYEGLLPEADGRSYQECDIDTMGASKRGAKRIVFSNDGLIYYTADHYESFELLYGEEEP